MGLHQKITSPTEAVPCDCGADDDHAAERSVDMFPEGFIEYVLKGDDEDDVEPDGYGSGV